MSSETQLPCAESCTYGKDCCQQIRGNNQACRQTLIEAAIPVTIPAAPSFIGDASGMVSIHLGDLQKPVASFKEGVKISD